MRKRPQRRESGFTLIELMLVVAIIGVLAAIAVPAYQDYTIRSRMSEGFTLVGPAQHAVAEYHDRWGRYPADNAAAGLYPPEAWRTGSVTAIRIVDGAIEVDMKIPQFASTLFMRPARQKGGPGTLLWICNEGKAPGGFEVQGAVRAQQIAAPKYLPAACRPGR
jgi:prepilin-type N-terminal cleavage/methylation domain-containing protein